MRLSRKTCVYMRAKKGKKERKKGDERLSYSATKEKEEIEARMGLPLITHIDA